MSPRSSKHRRLSTDSASKPPSSASFFSSFTSSNSRDGYTSALSSMSPHHSRKGSMDFPFPTYNSNPIRDQPCACAVLATPSGIFPCSLNPNPILSRSGILPSLHLPRSTTHPERTTRLPAMIPRRAQSWVSEAAASLSEANRRLDNGLYSHHARRRTLLYCKGSTKSVRE